MIARLTLLVALGACGPVEPAELPTYRILFEARVDEREPLAGVRLSTERGPLGETGADGTLAVDFRGPEGTVIPMAVACPAGHHADRDVVRVTLRRVHGLFTPDGRETDARIGLSCRPETRTALLLVRAEGHAGLPVLLDGEQVAVTDGGGIAHVLLRRAPATEVAIEIRTTGSPRLRPQNPRRRFTVPATDDFIVFDQPFDELRIRRAARPPAPPAPVRIGAGGERT